MQGKDQCQQIELVTYSASRRAASPCPQHVLTTHFHQGEGEENRVVKSGTITSPPGVEKCLSQSGGQADRGGGVPGGWFLVPMHQQGHQARGLGGMTLTRSSVPPVPAGPTFYVDLVSPEKEKGMEIQPELLPDERVICQADRVCSYTTSAGGMTSGHTGCLFVTTLRLSLQLPIQEAERKNQLLGEWDLTLSSIEAVFELYGEGGDKRRRLALGSTIASKVDAIFVLCKNFQFLRLSFKFAGVDSGRNITNALLHHSRPKKSELLFAFDRLSMGDSTDQQKQASGPEAGCWDWVLRAAETPQLRVSLANESWQVSTSLPRQFVVPSHVTDDRLAVVAGLGLGTRPPVWVWGTRAGGSLYIQPQSNVITSEEVRRQYGDFYHERPGGERDTMDLDMALPPSQQLEEAFSLMLELHCLETEKEAEDRDTRYFSALESTGWYAAVGTALRLARDVAERLQQGRVVVLSEGEGRCLGVWVASLAQILLSDEFRSRRGWEALVTANWVSLGFPFSRHHTLANLQPNSKPSSVKPIFLLFLDCVHQISHQFPSMMEFKPQYLVHVWDTAFTPVFDTFLFDCEHDRVLASQAGDSPIHRYSAWNWQKQFTHQQISSWDNPLYGVPLRPPRRSPAGPSDLSMLMAREGHQAKEATPVFPESKKFLPISGAVLNLEVWYQLFHRCVTFLQPDLAWAESLSRVRGEAKQQVTSLMSTTHRGPNNRNHPS